MHAREKLEIEEEEKKGESDDDYFNYKPKKKPLGRKGTLIKQGVERGK